MLPFNYQKQQYNSSKSHFPLILFVWKLVGIELFAEARRERGEERERGGDGGLSVS